MSKLIKRKDGSYSKRGLWDNIRKNKGSGKKPTKEMLKQEAKIKKEENMNSMYKKGGKASKKPMKKESFMEESKELHFGAPGVTPPKKFGMGGKNGDPIKATTDSTAYFNNQTDINFTKAKKASGAGNDIDYMKFIDAAYKSRDNAHRQANKGKAGYDKNGYPIKKENGGFGEPGKRTKEFSSRTKTSDENYVVKQDMYDEGDYDSVETKTRRSLKGFIKGAPKPETPFTRKVSEYKDGGFKKGKAKGGKSMEPGGGGRFAAMVNKLKSKGKSEEAAEGIAASAGRAKYGKGKFQAMAAAGKKKMMMGGKKC
jgi:hypothetical protein